MLAKHLHASHPKTINRLKRAGGHLQNVIGMLQEARPCGDIVQQLQAVESAIHAAKKALIHDHLDHCLDAAMGDKGRRSDHPLDEFKSIAKYL